MVEETKGQPENYRPDRPKSFEPKEVGEINVKFYDIYATAVSHPLRNSYILDSGSSIHVTRQKDRLLNFRASSGDRIRCGGGRVNIQGYGDLDLQLTDPQGKKRMTLRLYGVAYCPDFPLNIVSLQLLEERDLDWSHRDGALTVSGDSDVLGRTRRMHGQYVLEHHPAGTYMATVMVAGARRKPSSRQSRGVRAPAWAPADLWHKRLGHIGPMALSKVGENSLGVRLKGPSTTKCQDCALAKITQQISRRPDPNKYTKPFQRVHIDWFDLEEGWDDYQEDGRIIRRVVFIICEATGHVLGYFTTCPKEDENLPIIKDAVNWLHLRYDLKVLVARSDGEMDRIKTKKWLQGRGIEFERCAPDTHEQNGIAEAVGKLIMAKARAMRLSGRLPHTLWREIVGTAVYLYNRTPRQSLGWKSPHEVFQEHVMTAQGVTGPRKPILHHLKAYGCKAYVLIKSKSDPDFPKRLQKLAPRAHIGYLVGYESTSIYRIWIPHKKKVVSARDVIFDEEAFFDGKRIRFTDELMSALDEAIELVEVKPASNFEDIQLAADEELPIDDEGLPEEMEVDGPASDEEEDGQDKQECPYPTPAPSTHVTFADYVTVVSPEGVAYEQPVERSPTPRYMDNVGVFVPVRSEGVEKGVEGNTALAATLQAALMAEGVGPDPPDTSDDRDTMDLQVTPAGQEGSRGPPDGQEGPEGSPDSQEGPEGPRDGWDDIEPAVLDQLRRQRTERYYDFRQCRIPQVWQTSFEAGRLHKKTLPPPPENYGELRGHRFEREFKEAMKAHLQQHEVEFHSWTAVALSEARGHQVLGCQWVFVYKTDKHGRLTKCKARLVVRGDQQHDCDLPTRATTLATTSFRTLLALIAKFDLETLQMDAVNAFVHADLDETVFMRCPPGFPISGKVLRLNKALYGLRRSPLLWQTKFTGALKRQGFQEVPQEPCVVIRGGIICFFFVDDIVFAFRKKDRPQVDETLTALKREFRLEEMGELKWFLGMHIFRDRHRRLLWLSQQAYIEKLASMYTPDVLSSPESGPDTPMLQEELFPAPPDTEITEEERRAYQKIVGSILFAAISSRPDIAFASSRLSRFNQRPTQDHLQAAERVVRYLYKTRFLCCQYGQQESATSFVCASDASFADNTLDRKSSQGYVMRLFGGPIAWRANKQDTVTTSSTEAELLALSQTAKEAIYISRLFRSLKVELDEPLKIECDNVMTIRLLVEEAAKLQTKLRHVDIHSHWLRQEVQRGSVELQWQETKRMVADGLTKALGKQVFRRFVDMLGLSDQRGRLEAIRRQDELRELLVERRQQESRHMEAFGR